MMGCPEGRFVPLLLCERTVYLLANGEEERHNFFHLQTRDRIKVDDLDREIPVVPPTNHFLFS